MEDVVRRAASPMPRPARFPPFAPPPRRRSHLDSATYRTLVRIFSHCLDSPPDPSPVADSTGNYRTSGCNDGLNPSIDGYSNGCVGSRGQSGHGTGSLEEPVSEEPRMSECDKGRDEGGANNGVLDALEEQLGKDEYGFSELPDELISDFAGLIDLVEGTAEGDTKAGRMEVDDGEPKEDMIGNVDLSDSGDGVPASLCELEKLKSQEGRGTLGSSEELRHGTTEEEERDTGLATEKNVETAAAVENGTGQETRICTDSVMDSAQLKHLGEDPVGSLGALLEDEIEEGEILDDLQSLEQSLDSDGGHNDIEDQNSEERLREDNQKKELDVLISGDGYRFRDASGNECVSEHEGKTSSSYMEEQAVGCKAVVPDTTALPEVVLEKLAIHSVGLPADAKGAEVCRKQKRGPLTEERKAKKKKAKKRKRAEKERKQGVKRLKLQPNIKPKTVKYCSYYLKGRCQQGDLCKFSHDVIPLTKSQPCKYFARDTCLKGEDCPFDHQLSKYPCHNYMSEGMCVRGDKCKFSHKMPDGSPATLTSGKSDTPFSSEKSNLGKGLNLRNISLAKSSSENTASSARFSESLQLKANSMENHLKTPIQIPSGVRFLSFGKGSLNNSIKHQDNRTKENNSGNKTCNQGPLDCSWKSPLVAQSESKMMSSGHACRPAISTLTSMKSKNINFSSGLAASPSGSLQSEVSDASKLLDEFLFGDGS